MGTTRPLRNRLATATQRSLTEAEVDDEAWRQVKKSHDQTIRSLLPRHRGREIDTAGDGLLATFDGAARAINCAREITT